MTKRRDTEIEVDDVVARIRSEVARRERERPLDPSPPSEDESAEAADWPRLRDALSAAEPLALVGPSLDGFSRFGRVKRALARLVGRTILYLTSFITSRQERFNTAILQSFHALTDGLPGRIAALGQAQTDAKKTLEGIHETLRAMRDTQQEVQDWQREVQEAQHGMRDTQQEVHDTLQAIQGALQSIRDRFAELDAHGSQRDGRILGVERAAERLRTELVLQERRISVLLEEARNRLPEPFDREQLQHLAEEERHLLDAFYVSFEDQFRGTREEIEERVRVYLPVLKEGAIGSKAMPILDVGCGRGEWLEVLRDEQLEAAGVDLNRLMVERCRERSLTVSEGDAIAHLRGLPDASLGAVTAFHLIEHLPLEVLVAFFDETVRVLKSGGLAIFETPNPQNLLVGSHSFYLDPTHRNPLPSDTVRFLAEARGLCRVEVLPLHPAPATFDGDSTLAQRLNEFFSGPRDYAVMGWKV